MIYLGDNWPDQVPRLRSISTTFMATASTTIILKRSGSGYVGHHGKRLPHGQRQMVSRDQPEIRPRRHRALDRLVRQKRLPSPTTRKFGTVPTEESIESALATSNPRKSICRSCRIIELAELQSHDNEWHVRMARRLAAAARRTLGSADGGQYTLFLRSSLRDQPEHTEESCEPLWALHVTDGLNRNLD